MVFDKKKSKLISKDSLLNNFFYDNKKAFGSVASTLIMFIAIVGVSTGLVISFKTFVSDTQDSFKVQNDLASNKIKSSIAITNIYYDSANTLTYIYVKNIGEVKMQPILFDLFVDNVFTKNFTAYYADNLSKSITLFQPQDTMAIVYNKSLETGTHDVRIVSEYSNVAKDFFNI